jgi:hypothetical protein
MWITAFNSRAHLAGLAVSATDFVALVAAAGGVQPNYIA